MAVTAFWYGQAIMQAFGSGSAGNAPNIDFLSDTIKVMLCTNAYTPAQDTHVFKSDVTNEVTGTGYTAASTSLPVFSSAMAIHFQRSTGSLLPRGLSVV